ncbi:50S ribosomal protein L11 methyltransferase [Sphingomonas sp.]|uniref:50S ribosomal protein L11 methyltransferase n=1 Tax=Sphingomonas sp. TaxID=28214 RepID=UPI001D2D37BA|nr:50S ribosomal protein L11 methyltransferase [Sphingomonas sp.]MBX9797537.1 50S ribosomal protein L11 methyltransferase [Sphingomonas sp.]
MTSWKLTLPCTRAEAEAITSGAADPGLEPPPVLMATEGTPDDPLDWRLDAYFEGKPAAAAIAAVRALVPSAAGVKARAEKLPDADWVTLSQAGLEPVRAGRFFVHTSAHGNAVPPGVRAFRIEASRAFGTGHHETTAGCLMMLDAIRRRGGRVRNLIDLGTGTGLLAFAAMHLWPRAQATATDIDPVAIDMSAENAGTNAVPLGLRAGELALGVADGVASALVLARAPYDLVIANILAAPLIDFAPSFAAIAAPGAQIVLAGLLTSQADAVAAAYRRQGCRVAERLVLGDWTILRLRKRARARVRELRVTVPAGAERW